MIYFHFTEILISVFTTKQNVVSKDIKCSDKFLEKLLSLKIGIIVQGVDPNCLAATGTIHVI